jgi:hypothetical protein
MADRLFIATRKGLFTLERGQGWGIKGVDFLGDNCSSVLSDPRDGALYVALDHGHFGVKLHRSGDGGGTFEEIPSPVYPPAEEPEWTDMHGRVVPSSLELIWCLEAGHEQAPGTLWCGTVPGGLFRSLDHGDSWQLVESLWNDPLRKRWFGGGMDYPGIHSVCVHPDAPQSVSLAVSCGGVWQSLDEGTSWQCVGEGFRADYLPPDEAVDPAIQDVHRIAQCRSNPQVIWAQHHNGIFRSGDGGRTFEEIEGVRPSAFGFAVAVHPADGDVAWFVPQIKDERRIPVDGRVVVLRTDDGGRNFECLTEGLPQRHAYDICFRHALDVDESGEVLAFGSTTGGLWVSENGGGSWDCVSTHLPPVYAVRFGS